MATYYVRGYTNWYDPNPVGDDVNDGSGPEDAKATLASLVGTVTSGDTVNISGIVFSDPTAPFHFSAKTGVTIRQNPNLPTEQGHLHGAVRAPLSGWTRSGNRYTTALDASLVISCVTYNYHTSLDADNMRRAWLTPAGAVGASVAVDNAAWTNSSKTLTQTGKFSTAIPGGYLKLTGGTGVSLKRVQIVSATDDTCVLQEDINSTAGDIASGVTATLEGTSDTDNSWLYVATTGDFYVNTASAASSLVAGGEDVVTYVQLTGSTATTANLNGVYAASSSDIVVDGLHISAFAGKMDSTSYYSNGVQFYSCTNSTVRNCNIWDCGNHSISLAGLACVGNRMENINCYGLWSINGTAADGGNQCVFYSGGTDVTRCVGYRVSATCSHVLSVAGTEINSLADIGGFFSHTDGAGGRLVKDVLWDECTIIALNGECLNPIAADNMTYPSDGSRWENYPVRVSNSTITATSARLNFLTPLAFRRCRFDITPVPSDAAATGYAHGAGSTGATTLHECCDFTFRMGTNAFYAGFRSANVWTHYFYNCSFLMTRTTTTEAYFIDYLSSATNSFVVRSCIFSDASATGTVYLCVGDASASAARHDFKNCSYFNIDAANYSTNASLNAKAEWIANCDTVAQDAEPWFPAAQPFASATSASHDLARSSGVFRMPRPYGFFPRRGINTSGFSGHIGAWQYGSQSAIPRPRVHRHRAR